MAETFKQSLTRKQLDSGRIPSNTVMVEMLYSSEGMKTKGGVIVGFDTDVEYSEDHTSHVADLAIVTAMVYKTPVGLYYDKEDSHGMPWDCDMELEIGDLVWFNAMESLNSVEIECESKTYKLLPYQDLYVATRKVTPYDGGGLAWRFAFLTQSDVRIVIPLNGYVLLEPVYTKTEHSLAIDDKKEDLTRGIVRFVGKPNREYQNDKYADFQELEDGDLVLFNPNTPVFRLERKSYLARFDGDKIYNVVQRRRIAMILSKGN